MTRAHPPEPAHVPSAARAMFAAHEAADVDGPTCAKCGKRRPRNGRVLCARCGNTGGMAATVTAARNEPIARTPPREQCTRCYVPLDPACEWRDRDGRPVCGGCAHHGFEREGTCTL